MPEPLTPELRDLLALTMIPGLGPRLTAALLHHFGSAAAVRQASAAQLQQVPHIGAKLSRTFAEALAAVDLERELGLVAKHGVHFIGLGTPEYPTSLAEIPDPPHLLFVRGTLLPADNRAVAIVGSRGCTSYGRRITETLATGLVQAGYTVVSGLARGIDSVAHTAALKANGRTIAVLAGGLSRIYPPEHVNLAAEVAAAGAYMSESPMEAEPLPGMFPPRNRIISGLCRAVVIVEASERSGTLITARHAAEQGREVFAVPGPVDSPTSAGCLNLLRNGAMLARTADDVLESIAISEPARSAARGETKAGKATCPAPPPELSGISKNIWEFLADGARSVDLMVQHLQVPVPELTQMLMSLEMKRIVRRLPGNHYERW